MPRRLPWLLAAAALALMASAGQVGPAQASQARPGEAEPHALARAAQAPAGPGQPAPGAALVAGEDARIRALDRVAIGAVAPAVSPLGGGTIVLPARLLAWTLPELMGRFPAAFTAQADGGLLVSDDLFVGRGATLRITGEQLGGRQLRLRSSAGGFASIVAYQGRIELIGSESDPLTVTSWDPGSGRPDLALGDGRAFVATRGGVLQASRTSFAALGFGDGYTSGVAWAGLLTQVSQGWASACRFSGNAVGAFAQRAASLRLTGNSFSANELHGLDAHADASGFLVRSNTATRNGGNGLVFGRGARRNLVQGNRAQGNLLSGIVIDQRQAGQAVAASGPGGNLVVGNRAWGNRRAGIAIDGDPGVAVRGNVLDRNEVGVQVRGPAEGTAIDANTITASARAAVSLGDKAGDARISGNRLSGGTDGITLAAASDNRIEGNQAADLLGTGIVVRAASARNQVFGNVVERAHAGVQLADGAAGNLVQENRLLGNGGSGVHLSDAGGGNRLLANQIEGGRTGVTVAGSAATVLDGNAISGIEGTGIALAGDVHGTWLLDNVIAGRGPAPIARWRGRLPDPQVRTAGNRTDGWSVGGEGVTGTVRALLAAHPMLVIWAPLLILPSLLAVPARYWRRRRLARAPGRPEVHTG